MARSLLLVSGAATISILAHSAAALAADCFVDSTATSSGDGKSATTPVQTQAAIPSGCTTVRYARGSQFNEAVKIISGATTYTNYGDASKPLPDFKLPKGTASSVFQTFSAVTIDGIKFEGSHNANSNNAAFDSGAGICVYLQGSNSTIKNSEVTDCDFAIMLQGAGSLATYNYVHDVNGQALDGTTSSDPNAVGGGKGIYVMANNIEVSYNTIVNCITFPSWTGAGGDPNKGCDGGATEIAVGQSGGSLKGYKNHHNFAYNSCGFFQASTVAGSSGSGTFQDSEFYYNVMIDTAWMILAQVNNTNFVNMKWENNTVIQHKGAGPTADQGMLMEMWNGVSSGVSGGTTPANQVFLTNNLMVLEGVNDFYDFTANCCTSNNSLTSNTPMVMNTNIFLNNSMFDPGFIKLGDGMTVPSPADFDLTSDTIAVSNALSGNPSTISGGTPISGLALDFLNRAVPSAASGKTDIGAFQFDSVSSTTGGGSGMGGASSTGGTSAKATGGATSTGGSSTKAMGGISSGTGGSAAKATGGAVSGAGGSAPAATGAISSTGGASVASTGSAVNVGGSTPNSTGGMSTTGGETSTNAAQGGGNNVAGAIGTGGAAASTSVVSTNAGSAVDKGTCSCRVVGSQSRSAAAGWLALLMVGLGVRRNRRRV